MSDFRVNLPGAPEADDCPHCGFDLHATRVMIAGLILLCSQCLLEVPPAPASAWGPPVGNRATNWPARKTPAARVRRRDGGAPLPEQAGPTG